MNTSGVRFLSFLFFILLLFIVGCRPKDKELPQRIPEPVPIIIPSANKAIKERGDTLVALISNQSASYFMWKGRVLGYDYEMLNKFTEQHGLELRLKFVENTDSLLYYLNKGDGDLIAFSMAVTDERQQVASFTERFYDSPQVLVQKKPNNWRTLNRRQIDAALIRNIVNIEQMPIYVQDSSYNYSRLLGLGHDIGDSLNVIAVDSVKSAFDLIELVAEGRIEYTIANQEVAGMYASYHGVIDYEIPVSLPQKRAWAVRKNSPQLLTDLNTWLDNYKRYKEFYFIYDKYFNNPNTYRKITRSPYSSRTGKLSQYDDIIKTEAQRLGWDWRLLASQAYQESRFDQSLESWMGASGLMQIMPNTAKMHGFENISHAPTNVRAGVEHLKYINKKLTGLDSVNQLKFTLASYNVGLGHVYDAQRLATHLGKDPTVWDGNVADAMLLLSDKMYYQLDVCRNGYCRGREPYNYVKEILQRYESYKHLVN